MRQTLESLSLTSSQTLSRFGDHFDRTTRAFGLTDSAALAEVVVEAVALAGTELDDRVVGAGSETAIAFKAVPAGEAAFGLKECLAFVKAADYFIER